MLINLFSALSKQTIIIIVCAGALAVICLAGAAFYFKSRKKARLKAKNKDAVEKVKVIDGVRYTEEENVVSDGKAQITHNLGDIILERGREYVVKKGGKIIPGKYSVLSSNETDEIFNMRIGNFVREMKHNTDIVLSEGDRICAVSQNVILR